MHERHAVDRGTGSDDQACRRWPGMLTVIVTMDRHSDDGQAYFDGQAYLWWTGILLMDRHTNDGQA